MTLRTSLTPDAVIARLKDHPSVHAIRAVPRKTDARLFGWFGKRSFKLARVEDLHDANRIIPRLVAKVVATQTGSEIAIRYRYRPSLIEFEAVGIVIAPLLMLALTDWTFPSTTDILFVLVAALIMGVGWPMMLYKDPRDAKLALAKFVRRVFEDVALDSAADPP